MELIKGPIKKAVKIGLYGAEGIGKSTLVSQFPNPVFIDTEDSTKYMDVARTPKPTSWTMLLGQVKYFKNNPYECDTLALDTADWAERLCIEYLCARDKKDGLEGWGYGKGYQYLAEEFGRLLDALTELIDLGINVVLTAHAQMRKFEQPDEIGAYDRWELKLQKKTVPLVKEWADMLLFANYKTHVINVDDQGAQKGKNKAQGGKRIMHTTHHPCWDAKNRHNLPAEIPLDYSAIAHCITVRDRQVNKSPVQTPDPDYSPPTLSSEQKAETPISEKPAEQPQAEQPSNKIANIPKPLADLMAANEVTADEIKQVVAAKGYYPANTPIANYDPQFINGVLVGAWEQVFKMIEDQRLPF